MTKIINENILRKIIRNVLHEAIDELNLYHGTNADFDKFDFAYLSSGWGQQAYGYGFYLTTSYDAAKDYAYDANHGQVMEVEVPDGKYLTDVSISKAEANRIARIFFKYMTEENEDTRDSYSTEDEKRCFWDYEVDYICRCSTGSYVYGTIASLMGNDKDTSEFLHDKCGYVGLKIRDVYSGGKKTPITYVIFSPNDIKIVNKNVVNEEVDKSKIHEFRKIFTFGKYKGVDKTKVIQEDPEYCVWLYKKMKYSPFTEKQLGLLDVSYYKKYKIFPIKSATAPNYAQIRGVLVKNMTAEQLSYVYEHGTDEFKWLVKQEHNNRGWREKSHIYIGAPAFQTDDVGDAAWLNWRHNGISEQIMKTANSNTNLVANKEFDSGVGKFGLFKLSPALMSCIYEAAFQLLGYERFAIDGEMVMDNSIMDNPWDDAYSIIKWAIDNKGLNEKYLGKVSSQYSNMDDNQFHNYAKQVENGKIFWFSKEELSEIFRVLPVVLRKYLVQDMLNVGRTGKVRETVELLKRMNGGKNLEKFLNIMLQELRSGNIKRGSIANLKEPVTQAMKTTLMLGDEK